MERILIFAGILTIASSCAAQDVLSQADPAIQEQIDQVFDAKSEVEAFLQLQTLKKSTADKGEIVKQIAIFAAAPDADERQRLMAPVILHRLELKPKIIIRALAPYLDTENDILRSFVRDWFQAHDNAAAPGPGLRPLQPVNYEVYEEYVSGQLARSEQVPTAFIEYIYERSPGRALIVFYYANPTRHAEAVARLKQMQKEFEAQKQEDEEDNGQSKTSEPQEEQPEEILRQQRQEEKLQELLLAEHIVSSAIWLNNNGFVEYFQKVLPEAKVQLLKLSRYDQWWGRLYVAEIMRQNPELRLEDVLSRLSNDRDVSVRKVAKSAIE